MPPIHFGFRLWFPLQRNKCEILGNIGLLNFHEDSNNTYNSYDLTLICKLLQKNVIVTLSFYKVELLLVNDDKSHE